MPTLAIVGAGPGLGASLARRFAKDGYRVALLARDAARLAALTGQLRAEGVDAHAYPADVTRPQTLHEALTRAAEELDGIDFLEFSPKPGSSGHDGELAPVDAVNLTVEAVRPQIDFYLHGGITAVQAVLPAMMARRAGVIVVTTGASSGPVIHPPLGSIAAATAALRNWTLQLHAALKPYGVYAAHVAIAAYIGNGGPESQPDAIAEAYHDLVATRAEAELVHRDETLKLRS